MRNIRGRFCIRIYSITIDIRICTRCICIPYMDIITIITIAMDTVWISAR
jgi:hypothetical protein